MCLPLHLHLRDSNCSNATSLSWLTRKRDGKVIPSHTCTVITRQVTPLCATLKAAVSGVSVGYKPPAMPPAIIAAKVLNIHSGALKPHMATPSKGWCPSLINLKTQNITGDIMRWEMFFNVFALSFSRAFQPPSWVHVLVVSTCLVPSDPFAALRDSS